MSIDTGFGIVQKFEDFLVTAIADLPEIDIQSATGQTITVLAGGEDGRLQLKLAASDDDDVSAVTFGDKNWKAGGVDLYMEARFFVTDITDNRFFVGFADQVATGDDSIFDAAADAVTLGTDPADAIGILFDNDATTKVLWACAGKSNAVTLGQTLASRFNPVANQAMTLGVALSADRCSASFFVDGEEAYRIDSDTTLIAAVALAPGVWASEQGSAYNVEVDYLFARKPRATT